MLDFRFLEYELYFLFGFLIFALHAYLLWAYAVIVQLCNFLNIQCFHLNKQNKN